MYLVGVVLRSGVKNLYKYAKLYGGSDPVLVEGEVFTTTILLEDMETGQDKHPSTTQVLPKHHPR